MKAWKQGFVTQQAAFEWAASSRFFCARRLEDAQNRSKRKEKSKREMYNRFQAWAREQSCDEPEPTWTQENAVAEALVYFNRKAEYDKLMNEYARVASIHEARRRVKSVFNGSLVGEWTGLSNFEVKKVMDRVRERMGGEVAMDGKTMGEIRTAVEQANVELGNVTTDSVEDLTNRMSRTGVKDLTSAAN
jgi:hypothetical protein